MPKLFVGLLVFGKLALTPALAQPEAVQIPEADRAPACKSLLEKSAELLHEDISQLSKDVSYDPDCHWLKFEKDYSIYRLESLPFTEFANPSHPDWSLRQAKLLRRRGDTWQRVHDFGDRFNLIEIRFDRAGEAWWLQKVSGPDEPPSAEIWRSLKGKPQRFARLGHVPSGLRLDPLGRPWVYTEQEAIEDSSIKYLIRYQAGGELAEVWFGTASSGQTALAELGAALLPSLGWSAKDVKYGEVFFRRDGRPIAIPEGISTIHDPANGRVWLNVPQTPAAPWHPNRLFMIEADGRIRSFPALKEVSGLHVDRKSQLWLTTGSKQPVIWKIGADLKPRRQTYAIHRLEQAIGSVGFDTSSGFLLKRLALPKRLQGHRGYLERGLRSYGMTGDYAHGTEDLHLVDKNEMLSTDYLGFNSMGYDTSINLYYNPELDLIARSSFYSDTHSYDYIFQSSLYILENDLSLLDKLIGIRYYQVINP